MSDGSVRSARDGDAYPERGASIGAAGSGGGGDQPWPDRVTATAIAGHVLAFDEKNADAEDLLGSPGYVGEIRRLTIMFADLVDSTVLSTRVEPETYLLLVGRYRELVLGIDGGEHQVLALAGTSVRLRTVDGADSVVLAGHLMASPGFAVVDSEPAPSVEPFALLDSLPFTRTAQRGQ